MQDEITLEPQDAAAFADGRPRVAAGLAARSLS
jgi:hypothetical protein